MAGDWDSSWKVDFPTLGFLKADWVEQHCFVADGWSMGAPFVETGWQLWNSLNFYRVKSSAVFDPDRPVGAPAFVYRRGVIVGPQKAGKSPYAAETIAFEAVGPCVFAGFAEGGECYRCADWGCPCGWEYVYEPGEPMGIPRPVSNIQLLATAEDQTDNIYRPLQEMIRRGPLVAQMAVREGYIRLPHNGRIDPITAAPNSKLGAPIHFAVADESGIYTGRLKKVWATMRRGVAGMSGRSLEITNPYDPMENSVAQETLTSKQADIWRFYRKPPAKWSFRDRRERRKILEYVYEGSPWVDLDSIEAEAAELLETDPTSAERFFGNMLVQGLGAYLPESLVDSVSTHVDVPVGAPVCLGLDGSRSGDWTALRGEALGVRHRFTPTYGPDSRPTVWNPVEWPGERIPRGELDAAVHEMFAKYDVARMYVDPRYLETQVEAWSSEFGEDRVIQWPTNQIGRMFPALVRYREDMAEGITTHEPDMDARLHMLHARKVAKPGDKFILGKPAEHLKIDILMADVLAHEAAADMVASGWVPGGADRRVIVF